LVGFTPLFARLSLLRRGLGCEALAGALSFPLDTMLPVMVREYQNIRHLINDAHELIVLPFGQNAPCYEKRVPKYSLSN
jgi:hypothetical protein